MQQSMRISPQPLSLAAVEPETTGQKLVFGKVVRCLRCKGRGDKFILRAGRRKVCYLCHGKGYYVPESKYGRY